MNFSHWPLASSKWYLGKYPLQCPVWDGRGHIPWKKKQQRVFSLFSAQSQKWRQMLISVSPASRPIPFRFLLSGFEPQLLFSSQMLSQLSYNFEDTDRLRPIYCSSQLGIEYSSLIFWVFTQARALMIYLIMVAYRDLITSTNGIMMCRENNSLRITWLYDYIQLTTQGQFACSVSFTFPPFLYE